MNIYLTRQAATFLAATLLIATAGSSTTADDTLKLPAPKFTPGTEVKIDLPALKSWALVYVPKDYIPGRKWPVVVCYHGRYASEQWQFATTTPFKEITGGKGYVILGMNYATQAFYSDPAKSPPQPEIAALAAAIGLLEKNLDISRRMIFLGGVYVGGAAAGVIGESMLKDVAGLVIFSGGRMYLKGGKPPPAGLIRGKPVFIGAGAQDKNAGDWSRDAAESYRKFGAQVTYEVWPDIGFGAVDTKNTRLRLWLDTVGPLRFIETDLKTAQSLERSGKVGKAYVLYKLLGEISAANRHCKRAADAATTIGRAAKGQLKLADAASADKDYAKALALLKVIAGRYKGSEFGDEAGEKLKGLQADSTITDLVVSQALNTKANALEAQAVAAEKNKDYSRALKTYKRYVEAFEGAERYLDVKAHYESLKADPKIAAEAGNQRAQRDCKRLLNLAESYHAAGMTDKARKCLADIGEKYPGTEWARKAATRSDEMHREAPSANTAQKNTTP